MGQITLHQVRKSFGEVDVIPGVDLEIKDGEFVVFVGPSGCGKSTLLRLIAGLEDTTSGTISIDGKDATALPPAKRGLAMVFQSYALYPHMSVKKNIGFPLKMAGMDPAEAETRIQRAASVLNLTNYLDRKPGQLSGGQRQRVAIGRAIVRDARLFLFDEPLSNLDAQLRDDMRVEIKRLHQELGRTMIYVTHDQIEAMTLADRIVLLRDGRIEQLGSPLDLFERPANLFVASFLGSPKMNFIPATLDGNTAVLSDGSKLALAGKRNGKVRQPVILGIRPQHIALSGKSAATGHARVKVTVELVQPTGSRVQVAFPLGGKSVVAELESRDVSKPGEKISIDIDMTRAVVIDPQTEKVI
jgi:ABC-type sugar transport system ATPase subunit